MERGVRLEHHLVERLAASEGPIVTPSASCFGALTVDAPGWGEPAPGLPQIQDRLRDSTGFLLGLLQERPDLLRSVGDGPWPRVAYYDSCQTKRQLSLVAEPRRVLELAGYEVVDRPDGRPARPGCRGGARPGAGRGPACNLSTRGGKSTAVPAETVTFAASNGRRSFLR
ncbi:MAG: (Fe-S)-binding protein [Candidatus Dormibacteraeota bacterium]|nr:(Fe-S)-binding protein [Candidatus Dormibacteraeota bacterium]